MQGLNNFGDYIIDPTTNLPTIWPLTGDPVTGTGWYLVCPNCLSGFDQRYHVPTGPFNMAPNDTQEVVIAFLIKRGTDNINSITELRNYAAQIQHWYDNDFVTDVKETNSTIPLEYSLSQNYPNPFNPSTVISYQLPASGLVSLKVYDILGSEVATLVNEEKPAGRYEVEFKSTVGSLPSGQAGLQLASGVYFYRLQSGSFVETKKMILIK
ncbi:MAG: T9SS type A sorting domain-containing protein [Ignavibacteriaceae bacterium]|nr:T9SS type A sorting domain-containing protein [Ignavibacteriaceae bacterium]